MSAQSFSSFPVSFSTFPDLDPSQSNRHFDPENNDRKKKRKSKEVKDKNEGGNNHERSEDRCKEHKGDREGGHRNRHKRHRHEEKGKQREMHSLEKWEEDHKRNQVESDMRNHDETYRLYFIDTKGDPLNLQYGGLYAGDVPRYHRSGGGRQILGLSSAWTVFRRSDKGLEVGLKGSHKSIGLSDSASRSLLAHPPTKKLLPSATPSSKYKEIDGFIRLPKGRGCNDPEDSYRAITTSRDPGSDSDSSVASGLESDEDGSSDNSSTLTSNQLAIKNLEQDLKENPIAIDKWLLLLNHSLTTTPITSRNATKARSDITVSILSRALSADTRNASSKLLRLRYMKAGEEIWHESKVRAEWEKALEVGGVEIWMEWLEWRIRCCTKGIDKLIEDALRVYRSFGSGKHAELAKLRVFWRMAVVFRNAGFTEKAMAMFQTQFELTFKTPQSLSSSPFETRLSELEGFWESEVPRVGEEGAHGWNNWHDSGKSEISTAPSSTLARTEPNGVTQLDPYRQWAFHEYNQDQSSLLPAKSSDEAAQSDPYATVLFSDIRAFLFEVEHSSTKYALRVVWLSFLGLHIPGLAFWVTSDWTESWDLNWDDRWNTGYLTSRAHLDSLFHSDTIQNTLNTEAAAGVMIGREKEYADAFNIPVREWGRGVAGCLDIAVNGSMGLRSWWDQEDVAMVNTLVLRRLFAQMRMGNRDTEWDVLALGFESAVNLKSSLKLSRSLISTAQDSLLHWAAHAHLEQMRGRPDDARKVYQTVLIASKPARTATGFAILWWNWVELEWLAGNTEQAINAILRSVELEFSSTGVVILRAKRALEDAAETMTRTTEDEMRMKEREAWIKLLALFELLTGGNEGHMLRVFDRYLRSMDNPSLAHESMLLASLVMLYRYGNVLKNPMPPTILRERASAALECYPSNSIVLGIFLEGEKGQGVWGRVRAILGDNDLSVGKVKNVARRIEEIWITGWEKGRWRSETERTRSGLAGAVESERTRASPVIWRVYLEFEIRTGNLQKAKKALFRAIGECPLDKDLYLLAFGVLRSVFSAQELNSLADLMVERGIRLRKGLDDVLEGWDVQGPEESNGEGQEGGERERVNLSRERTS